MYKEYHGKTRRKNFEGYYWIIGRKKRKEYHFKPYVLKKKKIERKT